MNTRFDCVALSIQIDITACGAVLLDLGTGGAVGLVTDENDIMPGVAKHGFEVINDSAGIAHAATGDDDGRLFGVGQAINYGLVLGVSLDGEQLFKTQGAAAVGDPF